MVFNTFVVWALTGLWHGASWNFVLWGLWYFLVLMLERQLLKPWLEKTPVLSNLYVMVVVMLGWVIFRFTNTQLLWAMVRSLFGANGNAFTDFFVEIQFKSNSVLLLVSALACTPIVPWLGRKMAEYSQTHPGLCRVWETAVYGMIPPLLLLLSTACLVGDSYNPFIYFQF